MRGRIVGRLMAFALCTMGASAPPPEMAAADPSEWADAVALDFLVGDWSCDVRVMTESGEYEQHRATWSARYALDRRALIDEYRETGRDGELVRLGMTIRSYDAERGAWVMKWFDALRSTWLDLGPEDLGGVTVESRTIRFAHRVEGSGLVRITFSGMSKDRFAWRADHSIDGGETWRDAVMVIDARRVE